MNIDEDTIKQSITYLNQNKKEFLETYTKNIGTPNKQNQ